MNRPNGAQPSSPSSPPPAQAQTRSGTKRREEHWFRARRSIWRQDLGLVGRQKVVDHLAEVLRAHFFPARQARAWR